MIKDVVIFTALILLAMSNLSTWTAIYKTRDAVASSSYDEQLIGLIRQADEAIEAGDIGATRDLLARAESEYQRSKGRSD